MLKHARPFKLDTVTQQASLHSVELVLSCWSLAHDDGPVSPDGRNWYCLGHDVCRLRLCADVVHSNSPLCHLVSDEMVPDLNVLCPFVMDRVVGKLERPLIVSIDDCSCWLWAS